MHEIAVNSSWRQRVSAFLAMLGIVAEIVGHGLFVNLPSSGNLMTKAWKVAELWQSAAHLHIVHAVALYLLAEKLRKDVWYAMLAGILGFCGGCYLLATTNREIFGIIASLGEITLVLAWGVLAFGRSLVK